MNKIKQKEKIFQKKLDKQQKTVYNGQALKRVHNKISRSGAVR